MWRNGVYPHPSVRMISNHEMNYQKSFELVQEADVVIAAGTVAATAVASGKPTVMVGQGHYADYVGGRYVQPDHLGIYDSLFRYPLDGNDNPLDDLITAACAGDPEAARWRERCIGDDGAQQAVRGLEAVVGDVPSSTSDVIIEGVTASSVGIGGGE